MSGEKINFCVLSRISRPKLVEMKMDGKFCDWISRGENILSTTVGFHSIEAKTDFFHASIDAEICDGDIIILKRKLIGIDVEMKKRR